MFLHGSFTMPRPPFEIDPTRPYHIGSRCRNKDWFELPLDFVWEIMQEQLFFLHHAFKIEIYAYVLMANHDHLIARSPLGNLSEAMRYFKGNITRLIQKETGRINQIWGSRFSRTRLGTEMHFRNCYKYIYRNPVKAGIVRGVEEYQYSSLSGLLGRREILIPIQDDPFLFDDNVEKTILWLNETPAQQAEESIRAALRRSDFKLPKINNRPNPWEDNAI
jgi:putative transposase